LEDPVDVEARFAAESHAWPFPQFFQWGQYRSGYPGYYHFLFGATSLKMVTEADWSLSAALTTYKLEDDTATRAIATGGVWQFAEAGAAWVATNGAAVVVSDNRYTAYGTAHKYLVAPSAVGAVCGHKGRILYGGFGTTFTWPAHWDTLLAGLSGETTVDYTHFEPRDNWVFWSPINTDLTLLWEAPTDLPRLIRSNRFGFAPMPWKGTVYAMREFGNGVLVYGDHGIAYMEHITEPVPTFSIRKVADFGIMNRGSVGGDKDTQYFITALGVLYRISSEKGLEKLGYEEHFITMATDEIVMSWDDRLRECYVSGEYGTAKISYLITPQGVCTLPYRVYSGWVMDGDWNAIIDLQSDLTAYVATDWLDFGYKDYKTVTTVEVGADTDQSMWVALDYSNDDGKSWTRTDWVLVNGQGWARLQKTAILFRVAVKVASYSGLYMDYLNIHWQACGHQTRRGPSADTVEL